MATTDAEQVVSRFVAAWERADVDEMVAFFTDDSVWHPMPVKPAVGKPAIREAISRWLDTVDQLSGEIHLQVSDGRTVMHERTDHYVLGGRQVAHAIGAVFEIDNGLITAWREYFDMSPYLEAQRAGSVTGPDGAEEV
jgi:limonene-1,2-epoxide hydrolase